MKKAFVMVLDDDCLQRDTFQRNLIRLGCTVRAFESPKEALEFLELGDRPDLIISDLQMDGMSGNEFCSVVREKYGSVPFVLVSGSASVYELGNACGADLALMKPLYRETLIDILHDMGIQK